MDVRVGHNTVKQILRIPLPQSSIVVLGDMFLQYNEFWNCSLAPNVTQSTPENTWIYLLMFE